MESYQEVNPLAVNASAGVCVDDSRQLAYPALIASVLLCIASYAAVTLLVALIPKLDNP